MSNNLIVLAIIAVVVLVLLAAAGAVLLVVFARKKKSPPVAAATAEPNAAAELALEDWLARQGGKLPLDAALALLAPVLTQVAAAHAAGAAHLSISPDVIVVGTDGRARLMAPTLEQPAAYAAPEQLSGEPAGPWSDVYALCAVLYRAVSGSAPYSAQQRREGLQNSTFDAFGANEARAVALYNAMGMSPAIRPQTAGALLAALKLDAGVAPAATGVPVLPSARTVPAKRKSRVGLWVVLGCAGMLLLAGGVVGGGYIYFAQSYQAAGPLMANSQTTEALARLKAVPDWFRDTKTLRAYIAADEKLQQGDFGAAREGFTALGDFRDAQDRLIDVDYRQGSALLQSGTLDEAEKLFKELAQQGYKDSADLLKEVCYEQGKKALDAGDLDGASAKLTALSGYKDADTLLGDIRYRQAKALIEAKKYDQAQPLVDALVAAGYTGSQELANELGYQKAVALYNSGRLAEALPRFQALGDYQDAEQFILECQHGLYQHAVDLYRKGSYEDARAAFTAVPEGFENSGKYNVLIQAHLASGLSHDGMQSLFDALKGVGVFEDALKLRTNDMFIYYHLAGRWSNKAGYYFELTYKADIDTWNTSYNLPWFEGKYFKLENRTYFVGSDEDGWKPMFVFTFEGTKTLKVHCKKTGSNHTLTR